jgi:hypothetical protein
MCMDLRRLNQVNLYTLSSLILFFGWISFDLSAKSVEFDQNQPIFKNPADYVNF